MITIEKILDYVMHTPNNSNSGVLRTLLESLLEDKPQEAKNVEEVKEALVNGGNISLAANISLQPNEELTISAGKDVVIDANGKTITFEKKSVFNKAGIVGNTNLKIVNAIIEGTDPTQSSYPVVTGRNFSGNIILENCTFKNLRKCAVYMDPNGSNEANLVIKNCKYENTPLGYSIDMTRPSTNPFNIKVDFINNTGLDKLHEFEIFNGYICIVRDVNGKALGQYKTIAEAITAAGEEGTITLFTKEVEIPEGYKLVDNGDGTYNLIKE